jgi:hypothetical protein
MGEIRFRSKIHGGLRIIKRSKREWEYNIKVSLKMYDGKAQILIELAQERNHWWAFLKAAMKFQVL